MLTQTRIIANILNLLPPAKRPVIKTCRAASERANAEAGGVGRQESLPHLRSRAGVFGEAPGPSPLFLVDSNVRGAGKGLLLDVISRIVTGERFTIATYTDNEEELRKRITSLMLAGDRLVLFDNLAGDFGNSVLDAALTGTNWADRLLGVNRIAKAPSIHDVVRHRE